MLAGIGLTGMACARPQAPQGGAVPEIPLRVLETRPVHLSVVEPFDAPVEIRFAETVSERLTQGSPSDAVVVSPSTGQVEVRRADDRIEISMQGGFQRGLLYRITILPRFQDRYQNRMAAAFDLFFSTGPDFEPNLVAGLGSDRLTLAPVAEFRVDARVEGREAHLSAMADTAGIFSFPYLPSGPYTIIAYEDSDRDGEPAFSEIQDSLEVTVARGDTLIVTDLQLLAPDTTAAVLDAVEALDSMAIRVTFDDYLDPDEPLDNVQATVTPADGDAIDVSDVLRLAEWESMRLTPEPPLSDSAAVADPNAQPDSVTAGDPSTGTPPEADDVPPAVAPQPDGPPLPSQDLVLVLSTSLVPEETYEVETGGIRNINGLPDGGGMLELTAAARAPASSPPDPDAPPPVDPADPDPAGPGASPPAPG